MAKSGVKRKRKKNTMVGGVCATALASDQFSELMNRLHIFLTRCRELRLSISLSKTQLFLQEAVFGGSCVGKEGIQPDLAKLTAVVNWPVPETLLDLMYFLGLTGYFCSLIKDYAYIAAPLTDLQCNLDLPQPSARTGKGSTASSCRIANSPHTGRQSTIKPSYG